jgi:hypothetical protein
MWGRGVRLRNARACPSPAVFLAGVFDENEAPGGTLDLVKLPDWTHLRVLVEGTPLSLETGSIVEHRRILDLQHGMLFRSWRHQDQEGRVTGLTFLRVASLHDRHLLLQSVTITPENYSGMISIESVMEGPQPGIPWSSNVEGDGAMIVGGRGGERPSPWPLTGSCDMRTFKRARAAVRSKDSRIGGRGRREGGEPARFDRSVVVYSSVRQGILLPQPENICDEPPRRAWTPTSCGMRKPGKPAGGPAEWKSPAMRWRSARSALPSII